MRAHALTRFLDDYRIEKTNTNDNVNDKAKLKKKKRKHT